MEPLIIDTPLATIKRAANEVVEIHIKPDELMTVQRIRELFDPIDAHGLTTPARLLVVLPPGGVQFEMNVLYGDHFADRPAQRAGNAMALVTQDAFDRSLMKIYFKYFPSPQQSKVFDSESEARLWLYSL